MDELTRERYGPVIPVAESDRPPLWRYSDGRPDTPEKIAQRRKDLLAAMRSAR